VEREPRAAGDDGEDPRSIERFGFVENLVARPHPDRAGRYEVVSGNHRLQICAEMGIDPAPVVVADLDDAEARLLAQALNRTRGQDDPQAYAEAARGRARCARPR
jgi:ParB family chromosome partitioning protein